jgi:hypothetical protein
MLGRPLAFEQDKSAIFLRNQEMHLHFSKLDSIKSRKNLYLPDLISTKQNQTFRRTTSSQFLYREKQYYIQRDNNLIFKRLDKIFRRSNQMNNEIHIIDGYLNVKKYMREKFRELKKGLLQKENIYIKDRIARTKSVIDNRQIYEEFKKKKKISDFLRKIHPGQTVGDIYLNRKESQIIRQYEKHKMDSYLRQKQNPRRQTIHFSRNKDNSSTLLYLNSGMHTYSKNMRTSREETDDDFKIDKKILKKIRHV